MSTIEEHVSSSSQADITNAVFCVHDAFDRQATLTPDAIAVIADRETSYAELRRSAQRLAARLRAAGVGPDVPVALLAERSVEAVLGILGILKAGGAYVPIDPREPDERIRQILTDLGAPVILAQAGLRQRLSAHVAEALTLDLPLVDDGLQDAPLPSPGVTPEHVVAIVYTSGSTGAPRGVAIPHRSIMARLQHGYPRRRHDLQKARLCVAAHFSDLLMPLVSGGPVIMVPDGCMGSGSALLDIVRRYGTTRMVFVPSQLAALLEGGRDAVTALRRLDTVIVSGEPLGPALVDSFKRLLPDVTLLNAYGATEVAGLACMGDVSSPEDITVGRAISGFSVYVLDDALRPVSEGAEGEVCIGGEQLARGYWRDAASTAARFVDAPFSPGNRLYRTGDVGKYTDDGRLQILGRRDFERKVRGFRVNLNIVESVLERCPGVSRAIVVTEGSDADRRLTAYVQAQVWAPVDSIRLHAFARENLPPYMVPARIQYIDAFPLLPNGKVDRMVVQQALSAVSDRSGASGYVEPKTSTERTLAAIWQEVLGVPRVSSADGFVSLGGDSLSALRVVLRAEELGIRMTLEQLQEAASLMALASALDEQPRGVV